MHRDKNTTSRNRAIADIIPIAAPSLLIVGAGEVFKEDKSSNTALA